MPSGVYVCRQRERGPPSPSGVRSRNQAAGGANRRKREVTKTSGLRIDLGDGRSTEVVTLVRASVGRDGVTGGRLRSSHW